LQQMLQRNMEMQIMATLINSATPSATTGQAVGFFERLGHIMAWIGERRARSATIRELERLDSRVLEDLQITPHDFTNIADGTFRRWPGN